MAADRPLRIALVSAYYRPHVGGIERFTETLARGLVRRGHEVSVVCCRTERSSRLDERIDGYRVRRIRSANLLELALGVPYPAPWPLDLRRVASVARGADVLHTHEARYVTSWVALYAASSGRVPSVLTQHVGFEPQRLRVLDALQLGSVRASGHVARKATVTTTMNPEVAAWATREWGLRDVRVLPVGVEEPAVAPSRAEFGLPEDRFLVLFVGRDVPKKNLGAVLDALDPAFDVVAVSDARPAQRPGLHVFPFMAPDRLARLRASVDAFVLPSSGGEGLPLALQEAMVAGLPVVTTMLPGFERFVDVEDVMVVQPTGAAIRSALRALASDAALATRLAARSRAAGARRFGADGFVDAYEELYRSLVSSGVE